MSYSKQEENFGIETGLVKKMRDELFAKHFRFLSPQQSASDQTTVVKDEVNRIEDQEKPVIPSLPVAKAEVKLLVNPTRTRPLPPRRRLPTNRHDGKTFTEQLNKATMLGIAKYVEHKATGKYARAEPGYWSKYRHRGEGQERAGEFSYRIRYKEDPLMILEEFLQAGELRFEIHSLPSFVLDEYVKLLQKNYGSACEVEKHQHYDKKILGTVIKLLRQVKEQQTVTYEYPQDLPTLS